MRKMQEFIIKGNRVFLSGLRIRNGHGNYVCGITE